MNYYISDLHFGHFNIIKYENRPFKSTEEMDKFLIDKWNSVVKDKDTVYILGDFAFGSPEYVEKILKQLKGKKVLIRGNHDRFLNKTFDKSLFEKIVDYMEIKDGGYSLILSHYPFAVWDRQHYGSVHFYGHIHSGKNSDGTFRHPILLELKNAYNVGADVIGFIPKTAEEIIRFYLE